MFPVMPESMTRIDSLSLGLYHAFLSPHIRTITRRKALGIGSLRVDISIIVAQRTSLRDGVGRKSGFGIGGSFDGRCGGSAFTTGAT